LRAGQTTRTSDLAGAPDDLAAERAAGDRLVGDDQDAAAALLARA
jgi:hypothetical protein